VSGVSRVLTTPRTRTRDVLGLYRGCKIPNVKHEFVHLSGNASSNVFIDLRTFEASYKTEYPLPLFIVLGDQGRIERTHHSKIHGSIEGMNGGS